ncbi:unnamed protein product [Trifolium pratense]|uniref:Uncharacterized protein n=1 Tax=Trifolium pratense TaxID=57577 RepID=A0ACB0LD32_TRIPR|nr:unnamed protein product [Trifolium pratense]
MEKFMKFIYVMIYFLFLFHVATSIKRKLFFILLKCSYIRLTLCHLINNINSCVIFFITAECLDDSDCAHVKCKPLWIPKCKSTKRCSCFLPNLTKMPWGPFDLENIKMGKNNIEQYKKKQHMTNI